MESNTLSQNSSKSKITVTFRNSSESFRKYGKKVDAILRSYEKNSSAANRKNSLHLFFLSNEKWHQVIMEDVLYINNPD